MAPSTSKQLNAALEQVKAKLNETFELDDEFLSGFVTIIKDVFQPVLKANADSLAAAQKAAEEAGSAATDDTPTKAGKKRKQKKVGPKKVSGYNIFMRDGMSNEEYAGMGAKDKVKQIAAAWKTTSDEDKAALKARAEQENAAALAAWEQAQSEEASTAESA